MEAPRPRNPEHEQGERLDRLSVFGGPVLDFSIQILQLGDQRREILRIERYLVALFSRRGPSEGFGRDLFDALKDLKVNPLTLIDSRGGYQLAHHLRVLKGGAASEPGGSGASTMSARLLGAGTYNTGVGDEESAEQLTKVVEYYAEWWPEGVEESELLEGYRAYHTPYGGARELNLESMGQYGG